ncbi:MAG: efflux RND transporter permease subunit, partial [Labilibaculum sp.]|nr:efflux RND transporter permease subunit [Labilibaculum sp.]
MSITELSIKRSTLVVVIFAVLTILGITSYRLLKYDLLPGMNFPVVYVNTMYPGASANDVESSVTKKIEDALSSLENIDYMQSTSQEGVSSISLWLQSGTNVDKAIENAQRKVNAILADLPVNARTPSLQKFSSDEMPVMKLGVTAKMKSTELYQFIDKQIKSQFSKIDGVGQLSLVGGSEREIKIEINKKKLDAYKISIVRIYAALNNASLELPTGKIESDQRQYTVRLAGKIQSIKSLQNVIVSQTPSGSLIRMSDVAQVYDGIAEYTNLNRINNESSIGIVIQKQSDANTVEVCEQVKEQISQIEEMYSDKGLKFDIASDTSVFTLNSANAVMDDLILAVILVAMVMFFFLHSFRNSLIVMVSIPASIVSVFAVMYIFDFSLNLMTLLGLSLVIGILVDDSIVVLENIHRHLDMGKDKRQAAIDGRKEIGFTALAITMIDVVTTVPLAFMAGIIGNMLREFALVLVFSTLMSLFVSFTITPLLASRFSRIEKLTNKTLMGRLALGFERIFNKIIAYYGRVLNWALSHRKTVYSTATVLFFGSFALIGFGFIGTEFIPEGDRGEFMIKLETSPQNTLYKTNLITQEVEDILFSKPEVVKVFTNVGYSSTGNNSGNNEQNKTEITVNLVPKEERSQSVREYASMIKAEVMQIPGVKATATPISMMGNADDAPIQILLRGPEVEALYKMADSIMAIMATVQGIEDLNLSVDKTKPEMQIALDREKMSMLGLSVFDVANTLRLAYAGNSDLKFSDHNQEFDINLRFNQSNRESVKDIHSLTFLNNQGKLIELQDFATIFQSLGPDKLERYDRISSLTVNASVSGRPVGTVGDEIKQLVSNKIQSKDITIEYKGQLERQSDAFGSLLAVIFFAIILGYLVMVALYNSYLYPFIVLFSIPMAIIGALLALALTGHSLNIFTILAIIILLGLVAKNAILVVNFANQLKEEGYKLKEALIEAGTKRLRPIAMTTLTLVFGMIPIALATGASSELKNGLAWVIIGGMLSSLVFTLILVPTVYYSFDTTINKFKNRKI